MPITVYYPMKQRGDTKANWIVNGDTVPLDREICIETDTRRFKLGDGVTTYSALKYAGGGGTSGFWWIKEGEEITIEEFSENICTGVQVVEGTLIIDGIGRNTVL